MTFLAVASCDVPTGSEPARM